MDAADKEKCLTAGKRRTHLAECGLKLTVPDEMEQLPVVIRTEFGDVAAAAVHRAGDRLVIDFGMILEG